MDESCSTELSLNSLQMQNYHSEIVPLHVGIHKYDYSYTLLSKLMNTCAHFLSFLSSLFSVAKTAGSHVTMKGLYFLLPVIIIDGLVWDCGFHCPPPPATTTHIHTSVRISIQTARLNSPYFLDRPRNRSFIQQVLSHWLTYVHW